jgi:hypothetical protein
MLDHQTVSTFVMAVVAFKATPLTMATKKNPKKRSDSAVPTPQNGNPVVVVSILSYLFVHMCMHANHPITDGITCLPLPANR